jgi:FACT complex subunit SSRP1/POB3
LHSANPYISRETYDNIYLDLSKNSGRCRFADSGIGWKPAAGGDTWTLDRGEIVQASFGKGSKGYELRIIRKEEPNVVQLDGFQQEDVDQLSKIFKNWYSVHFENKEHSLRGWNWGKTEFGKNELSFMVQNRSAFDIPYSEVAITNLAGKNEVAVSLSLQDYDPEKEEANGTNGDKNDKQAKRLKRGHKAACGPDELVEMRLYVPGNIDSDDPGEESPVDPEDRDPEKEQDRTLAGRFYLKLSQLAGIGNVAGETIATFTDVLHLTPRGRFEVDLYLESFRLRGKTYDYSIKYDDVKKFMLLPKPDEVHTLCCLGLDPPLRQGQTRYPFLVMQFKREEEVTLDINLTEEQLNSERYKGRISKEIEAPVANVFAQVFRALSNKKVITPAKDFLSVHRQAGLKCSIKANEGHLYIMDKSFLFVPKPATYVAFETISSVTFSRVGGALAASRTFDVTVKLKEGRGEHQFSNVNREEQGGLEDFLKLKGIKVKNEMVEDVRPPCRCFFTASLPLPTTYETLANHFHSTRYSRPSRMSLTVKMKLCAQTADPLTKTRKVPMMISKEIAIQMSLKSSTVNMPAVVEVKTKTLKPMTTMMQWRWKRNWSRGRRRRPKNNSYVPEGFFTMISYGVFP